MGTLILIKIYEFEQIAHLYLVNLIVNYEVDFQCTVALLFVRKEI